MPGKLTPGTPSMLFGRMSPCQWTEVSSSSLLWTRMTASSPSVNRRSGPGTDPFIVTAVPVLPPNASRVRSMVRSYSTRPGRRTVGASPSTRAGPRVSAERAQAGVIALRPARAPKAEALRRKSRRSIGGLSRVLGL